MRESGQDPERLELENDALRQRVAILEAEARRSRATLYSIGDGVIATDAAGAVTQMNRAAEALTGWREGDALGRPAVEIFRIVNEETRAKVESPIKRVLRDGGVVGLANHTMLIAKDGTERPIADCGAPIRDDAGVLSGVVLVFRDQSEERRAEAALRQAEERFRSFFDNAPIGKSMTAPDGRLLRVNAAFAAMLGNSLDEMQAVSFAAITHPDDVAESRECVRALLAGERDTWVMDKRYRAKDGRYIWTRVTTRLQRDDRREPQHFLTHIEDIGAQRAAQQELLEAREGLERKIVKRTADLQWSKELLDATGELARVGGWEIDLEKNELTWTDVVHQIHEVEPGYRPTVEAGINFYAPEAVPVISEAVRRAVEEGQPFDVELQLVTAKKNRIWVRAVGEAIRQDGRTVKVRGVFQDIHQRKLVELALQEHREHLEESNQELEAFSYSVSHDLRAPLRAIDGFTHILADDYASQLPPEGQRLCSIVRENAGKMSRLIDDLLAFSRLGRAEMCLSRVDMGKMADSIYHELTTPETRSRIDFRVGPVPSAVADPTLMRQVWTNLLSNAIKFSSKRERAVITVGGQQSEGENVYTVQDDGAGFDMQYVGKLFGVFQRLHSAREFEGTGVGLALVQRVIRRHGGRVWGQGEPDRGATFSFALRATGD